MDRLELTDMLEDLVRLQREEIRRLEAERGFLLDELAGCDIRAEHFPDRLKQDYEVIAGRCPVRALKQFLTEGASL